MRRCERGAGGGLKLDHRLTGIEEVGHGGVRLPFANGQVAEADAAIGADGVNSLVRTALFGATNRASPAASPTARSIRRRLLDGFDVGNCTKWWGEDRHIVMYPVKPDRSEVYFVTSQPEPGFEIESW